MKGLHIISFGLIFLLMFGAMKNHDKFRAKLEAMEQIMAEYELKVEAKTPLIKFYTIPGYNCDTSNWPGLCSNLGMDQKEYELKNSHLFKVTQ